MNPQPRDWVPDVALGIVVAALGVVQALTSAYYDTSQRIALVLVALSTAGIVTLSRRRPGLALALVWVMAFSHVAMTIPVLLVEVSFVVVSFATARWGRPLTVALGGLSIPTVAALALFLVAVRNTYPLPVGDSRTLLDLSSRLGGTVYIGAAIVGLALLGVPWLAGLVLRFRESATTSQASQEIAEVEAARAQRETEQAHEIARLRDDQARLARDVHDVVGHSLAVILAQAESAQYLPDRDTEKLKATMATIATSARSSLQDVRHVLTAAQDAPTGAATPRPLDTLVEGVRASGHEVVSRELGTPQPLPPELEVVAYRVLQEMLTNALKHGDRDEPVFVERLWPDGSWSGELRIEVRNRIAEHPTPAPDETRPITVLDAPTDASVPPQPPASDGRGLDGMRGRLEACGGRLDVRRRVEPEGITFTTTAWVPVRTVAP